MKNIKNETFAEKVINNGVLICQDGELFLSGGKQEVLYFFSGQKIVSGESKYNFRKNITSRAAYCKRNNILYKHIVFPDKHNVYANKLSFLPISLYEKYYHGEDNNVIYPIQFLKKMKQPPFLKLDTHLSDYCNHKLAHWLLFCILKLKDPRNSIVLQERQVEYNGDLGSKLTPICSGKKNIYERNWGTKRWTNNVSGNDGIIDIYINNKSQSGHRVLVFGDSFFRTVSEFIAIYVSEVVFCRTRYFHYEIAELIRPTIILSGNIERYLSKVFDDDERPNFLLYPSFNQNTTQPTKDFVEALNAQLCYKRAPYINFMKKQVFEFK